MSSVGPTLPEGVHHWTATHPEWEGPVSAYAIDDGERLILVDPIAVPDDVRALLGSREAVTVLTSTWHERDAASLGLPVWAPAPDRLEEQLVPATRYAIGDSLFGMEAYPGREGQLDLVLWCERIRAVIAGDTLISLGNGLEIPASWLPEGVTVEEVAAGLRPLLDKPVEFVLSTHGDPADRAAFRTRSRLIGGACFSAETITEIATSVETNAFRAVDSDAALFGRGCGLIST